MSVLFDFILMAGALAAALQALIARERLSAVFGFIALGLLLRLVWVRLGAPDVALTEAAIGGGVTGLLLVRAAMRMPPLPAPPPGRLARLAAGGVAIAVTGTLVAVMSALPDPAPTRALDVAPELAPAGLGNPVTAVLMVFRAVDTLLETVVVVLALIGVWSLAPDRFWGGAPAPLWEVPPSGALVFLARLLPPIGIVIAAHLLWTGADNPGGKFQSGAVLAAMWLLVLLAGLSREPSTSAPMLRAAAVAGPAVFMGVGILGALTAGSVLGYPEGLVKPFVVLVELASTLSIAVALGLLVLGPPQRVRLS